MKKRILPILLSLALTLPILPATLAAPAPVEDMAQVLSALDIMTGNENGDLMLSRRLTRAEFTKLVVAASPYGKNVGASTTVSPYPDVPYSHWAAPYVEAAVSTGLVNGYLDGTFHPDETITLAMGVTMAAEKASGGESAKAGKGLIQASFLIRTLLLFVVMFALLKSGLCNVFSLVLPLLFIRPILIVEQFFQKDGEAKS